MQRPFTFSFRSPCGEQVAAHRMARRAHQMYSAYASSRVEIRAPHRYESEARPLRQPYSKTKVKCARFPRLVLRKHWGEFNKPRGYAQSHATDVPFEMNGRLASVPEAWLIDECPFLCLHLALNQGQLRRDALTPPLRYPLLSPTLPPFHHQTRSHPSLASRTPSFPQRWFRFEDCLKTDCRAVTRAL